MRTRATVARMQAPSASVILLTYNQRAHVGAALESVLRQDVDDIEVLVCDDHSTDGTWEEIQRVLEGYAGRKRVRAHRQPENIGVSRNNRLSIEMAAADLQISAHGDDLSAPTRVRRLLEVFRRTGASMVSHGATIGSEPGSARPMPTPGPTGMVSAEEVCAITWDARLLGATFAWDRRLWQRFGFFDPALLPSGGDHVLPLRAALSGGFFYIAEPLMFWRQHDAQMTALSTGRDEGTPLAEVRLAYNATAQLQRLRDLRAAGESQTAARLRCVQTAAGEVLTWSRARARLEHDGYTLGWVPR